MDDVAVSQFLVHFTFLFPLLLVEFVGLALAALRFRRHPVPSTLVLAGLGLVVTTRLTGMIVNSWLIARGVEEYIRLSSIIGMIGNVCVAIGYGLVIAAVFAGRSKAVERGD